MTDVPEFFEVQQLAVEGNLAGQWCAAGVTNEGRMSHALACTERDRLRERNPGHRFRVVPFGTGPVDFEPGETMPGTPDHERKAWDMLAERVRKRGGAPDDIVRHVDSFRWYGPAGELVEIVFGAELTAPEATDVTAGGGC